MSAAAVAPAPFLRSLVSQKVIVKSKWGPQYYGTLVSCDAHMNLQLSECIEYTDTNEDADMESVVIRCNNVLYVRQVDQAAEAASLLVTKGAAAGSA